jgi:hypothetical protein
VASKIAFAIAPATIVIVHSPAPMFDCFEPHRIDRFRHAWKNPSLRARLAGRGHRYHTCHFDRAADGLAQFAS